MASLLQCDGCGYKFRTVEMAADTPCHNCGLKVRLSKYRLPNGDGTEDLDLSALRALEEIANG